VRASAPLAIIKAALWIVSYRRSAFSATSVVKKSVRSGYNGLVCLPELDGPLDVTAFEEDGAHALAREERHLVCAMIRVWLARITVGQDCEGTDGIAELDGSDP
jgi:hypothetical protein